MRARSMQITCRGSRLVKRGAVRVDPRPLPARRRGARFRRDYSTDFKCNCPALGRCMTTLLNHLAMGTSMRAIGAQRPRISGKLAAVLLFLPPALLLFTLFVMMPVVEAAWYSGFNWNGFGSPKNWIGFDNYRFVFDSRAFGLAFRNNILIIAVSLFVQLPLALSLALILSEKFRGA